MTIFLENYYNLQKMMKLLDRHWIGLVGYKISREETNKSLTKVGIRLRDLGHLLIKDMNADYFKSIYIVI